MARILRMAWGDTTDPQDISAGFKTVTDTYAFGPEILSPRDSEAVAFDLVVATKGAASELDIILQSSINKTYWADLTFLDSPLVAGEYIYSEGKILVYTFKNLADSYYRHIRLNLATSEFLRMGMKGDVAGASAKVFATFVEDMGKE